MAYHPTRKLTVLALDPSVRTDGRILRTQIEVPNEVLEAGPRGYRVSIVDYDSSTDSFRAAKRTFQHTRDAYRSPRDPFEKSSDAALLASPDFHGFMTYGIVMKTLARFEHALGRRLSWSFGSHQIQVSPRAFADANAFYSDTAQGLLFGYFPSNDGKGTITPASRTRSSLTKRLTPCWMGSGSDIQIRPHRNRLGFTKALPTLSRSCRSSRPSR